MSFPDVTLVSLSGIPGVGKSRARKRLAKTKFLQYALDMPHVEVVFVAEPVKLWKERGYLRDFYADPSLHALPFQLIVFDTHVEAVENAIAEARLKKDKTHILIVVERCMFDQLLFWEQQVDLKQLTAGPMFDEAYQRIWTRWNRFVPPVSIIFFFHTSDIQQTMQRMKSRARAEELGSSSSSSSSSSSASPSLNSSMMDFQTGTPTVIEEVNGLTLDYQTRLQAKHLEWFTEPVARPPLALEGIKCVHVNVDAPYHVDDGSLKELADTIASHLRCVLTK